MVESKIDWTLSNCCSNEQIVFCCCFGGFLVLNFFLWNTFIVKPMKLIAVFVHELCHAIACWMTCGTVKEINVEMNEGGVTKYVGGNRLCIIPAGYLGGAFWGGVFVACSGDRYSATAVAILFVLGMLFSLCYAPNGTMIWVTVLFIVITTGVTLLEWLFFTPILPFVTLYFGVFIGSFSVYDIYDDLIIRTVAGSDAHACHQLIPCCLPRCVGVQFAVIALTFQVLGVYGALVAMGSTENSPT